MGVPAHRTSAPAANIADRRRWRDQESKALRKRAYATISYVRHGRNWMAAQDRDEARVQMCSKAARPKSVIRAANGAAIGNQQSINHRLAPSPINPAATGTRNMFAIGPTTEPLPNVEANNGQSATAIAAFMPNNVRAARAARGHDRGAEASSLRATVKTAAVPPTLITAPVERAAAGLVARRTAAAKVRVAEGVVGRSKVRAAAAAASMSHARTLGGSAPDIRA